MGFLDEIQKALGGEEEEAYQKLLAESNNTPTGAMLQSDVNRGVLPGKKSGWAESLPPTRAARIDRYAWGKQAGLGGIPVATGYELLKGISQTKAGSRVLPAIAQAMGFEDTGEQFQQDETSSPASFGNVGAYIRGALRR